MSTDPLDELVEMFDHVGMLEGRRARLTQIVAQLRVDRGQRERDTQDAQRWRAIKPFLVLQQIPGGTHPLWWIDSETRIGPVPESIIAAADRLGGVSPQPGPQR
jgi:hypothetical protein